MDAARELRELRRIERRLTVNDPELAAALSAFGASPRRVNRRPVRLAVDLLGALCVVAGVTGGFLALIFVGVAVLMTGACMHTTCRRRQHRRDLFRGE